MANVPSPQALELAVNDRIQEAIDRVIDEENERASKEYVGRVVRFHYKWHSIDSEWTLIEVPISAAYLDQGEGDGPWHLLFDVKARNPHNGHIETITRWTSGVDFV